MRFLLPYWVCSFQESREKNRKQNENNTPCFPPPQLLLSYLTAVMSLLSTQCCADASILPVWHLPDCFPGEGTTAFWAASEAAQSPGHCPSLYNTCETKQSNVPSWELPSARWMLTDWSKYSRGCQLGGSCVQKEAERAGAYLALKGR